MVDAGMLGPLALWLAIGFGALAIVTGKRSALAASAVGAVLASGVLAFALFSGDFSLEYVARTTSLATPWPYRVAALWGGTEGSLLFYATLTAVIGLLGTRGRAQARVVAGAVVLLLAVTAVFANPFATLDIPAIDGAGLLAILQHPAMIYHPPILYLGLVALLVPFAEAWAHRRHQTQAWIVPARRWAYRSWLLLTVGIAAGSNWAYVELGWGGFWAWDPVENTALIPWLALTMFIHVSPVTARTGRLPRLSWWLAGLPFALSLLGVYLTRSGVTGSIHSFAEDATVGRFLIVAAALVLVVLSTSASRRPEGTPWPEKRLDRDGWMAVNAGLLGLALVFITVGSGYPAVLRAFAGESALVGPGFYVATLLPIGVLIAVALYMALARRARLWGVSAAIVAVVVVAMSGPPAGAILLVPAAATTIGLLYELIARSSSKLGPSVAHLGFAIVLVAVAGSTFGGEFEGTMRPGDSVEVAGHTVTLTDVEVGQEGRFQQVVGEFIVDGDLLRPEIRAYEDQVLPVSEPVLRSTPVDDVIVALSLLFPDGETVQVSVFVRPTVWWLWFGAGLVVLGGLLSSRRGGGGGGRRRSATAEPQRGGTTIGTASE